MNVQTIRLIDVFLLGPFMIWAGARATGLPGWANAGLVLTGLATIAYNGSNYLSHARTS